MAIERKRSLGLPLVGGTAFLVLLVGAWLVVPTVQRWADAGITVPLERLRVATVTRGPLVRDVSVQGRVVAAVRPTLYAPAAGTITLQVNAGDGVSEGDVLASILSPELTSELSQAEAALQQQSVELDRQRIESRQQALEKRREADLAEVRLTAALREMRRAEEANRLGVIPLLDFEKAQDDLRNAELTSAHATEDARLFNERLEFELQASELALQRQRLLVEDLRRRVDELAIRSPVDGIVGDLLVEQKAAVSRDMPVMAVVDLSRFEVEALIPESYADDLAPGMSAEVNVGSRPYPARLVAVSPEIVGNQVSTRIRFVGDMPPNIRQNQQLTSRVLIEEIPDALQLPRGQFLDTGGGRIAYVLDGRGLAHRQPIRTGARSLAAVQITEGLREGDQVVISSSDLFRGADTVLLTD